MYVVFNDELRFYRRATVRQPRIPPPAFTTRDDYYPSGRDRREDVGRRNLRLVVGHRSNIGQY